jgi:positive regulator of sigma E activity
MKMLLWLICVIVSMTVFMIYKSFFSELNIFVVAIIGAVIGFIVVKIADRFIRLS